MNSKNMDGFESENRLTRGSVTLLLDSARSDSQAALAGLWQRYWESLVRIAGQRCQYRKALVDPEFIAQSVFNQVCNQILDGKLEEVDDRDEFWTILLNLTKNKAIDHFRAESRLKRGGALKRKEGNVEQGGILNQIPTANHSEEDSVDAADLLDNLILKLDRDDPSQMLSDLIQRRIAGQTVTELSEHFEVTTRTIERKLSRIRGLICDLV
ncbi:ECF-type sigma factor [Pirellulaceae bacterium]|nr:ECF-type sigma factor [Pirellulaceae bacterium]